MIAGILQNSTPKLTTLTWWLAECVEPLLCCCRSLNVTKTPDTQLEVFPLRTVAHSCESGDLWKWFQSLWRQAFACLQTMSICIPLIQQIEFSDLNIRQVLQHSNDPERSMDERILSRWKSGRSYGTAKTIDATSLDDSINIYSMEYTDMPCFY